MRVMRDILMGVRRFAFEEVRIRCGGASLA
jgi:hypothetical protein